MKEQKKIENYIDNYGIQILGLDLMGELGLKFDKQHRIKGMVCSNEIGLPRRIAEIFAKHGYKIKRNKSFRYQGK